MSEVDIKVETEDEIEFKVEIVVNYDFSCHFFSKIQLPINMLNHI